ncbi:hypothetical protein [Paenibacillus hamazuiensis]|uniref:hypothetical protein n=1 Tax=Paenibacillus hamazuiensis TaxID=2936508 RepID=UPI00200EA9F3|nr:hypothetical protein [Paenibacillus hamazuiensis]
MARKKSIRIAVIGPNDSLHAIRQESAAYQDVAWKFQPYEDVRETVELIASQQQEADVILVSGEVPYQLVRSSRIENSKPLLYIPHTGTALYRTLFEMNYHHAIRPLRISIDTLSEQDVREAFQEMELPFEEVYMNTVYKEPDEWGRFHLDLWQAGKIDAAITTLSATMGFLQKNNVPVFRIRPTRSTIRSCIDNAIQVGMLKDAQKGQILIQLIQIDQFNNLVHYLGSEYAAQQIQLELHKRLLDYARDIEGAFTALGRDSFFLVTTHGAYKKYTEDRLINPIPERVLENLPVRISVGIGEGLTGIEAEMHAKIALKHAQDEGGDCAYFASLNGEVSGPLDNEAAMTYNYQLVGDMVQIAQEAGISPKTLAKISHLLDKLERREISSMEIAQHFKITPRQARRILNQLENAGVAVKIGEEGHSASGRPRIIYRISDKL